MTSRADVYAAIDGERDYQDRRWEEGLRDRPDTDKCVAEWLSYVRHVLKDADDAIYYLTRDEALACVRKIAALAVRCMEVHGAPKREKPAANDSAEVGTPKPMETPLGEIGVPHSVLLDLGLNEYLTDGPLDRTERATAAIHDAASDDKTAKRAISALLGLLADARSATKDRPDDFPAEARRRVDVYLGRKTDPAEKKDVGPKTPDEPVVVDVSATGPEHDCEACAKYRTCGSDPDCVECNYDPATGYSEWTKRE